MVASSGVNFGFRRTVPHILGIFLGFPLLLVTIGLGLGAVISGHPALQAAIKYLGCGYLLYTAVVMAFARSSAEVDSSVSPKSFQFGLLFQWINPKAWVMGVSAMAAYTSLGANHLQQELIVSFAFGCVGLPSIILWTIFGALIADRLRAPQAMRIFNIVMGAALALSLLPVLFA